MLTVTSSRSLPLAKPCITAITWPMHAALKPGSPHYQHSINNINNVQGALVQNQHTRELINAQNT